MSESRNAQRSEQSETEFKGWLYKRTNYLKGYQKRWFVLSSTNGLLSYYRTHAEVAHTCRGTISLQGAFIHTEDSNNFTVSNGGSRTFHLKAASEVERQKWVTAIELAKAKAIRKMEEADEEVVRPEQPDKNELQNTLRLLNAKLEELNTCNDLITKHGATLQRSLAEVENLSTSSLQDLPQKFKTANERATLFRITTNAMINACSDYVKLTQQQGHRWVRALQYEHEQRLQLEEMVEQLARQHSSLENAARQLAPEPLKAKTRPGVDHLTSESDEDEFHDAVETNEVDFEVEIPVKTHRRTASGISIASMGSEGAGYDEEDQMSNGEYVEMYRKKSVTASVIAIKSKSNKDKKHSDEVQDLQRKRCHSEQLNQQQQEQIARCASAPGAAVHAVLQPTKKRRTAIKDRPNHSLNLWTIMKNCIGKELSKIPMPVNFSEPLSMLQRLTEDFEYAYLLDGAAQCDDPHEQMAYVAAFTVSSYSTTTNRTYKPFNPLLGETYECDRRDDLGWRAFSEQVSHHPPAAAQFAEGQGWVMSKAFCVKSKFRGKYIQVMPVGFNQLEFAKSGNVYTWKKVMTTVHNIIVGKLWIDQSGEMDIVNHKTKDVCRLKYYAYSYFSREAPRKITGVVTDAAGSVRWVLSGHWDDKIEGARVIEKAESSFTSKQSSKPLLETYAPVLLWKRRVPPPENSRFYNFTPLTVQLNEPEEGVAPTDSRMRPDQRAMEEGDWDAANDLKVKLEEKQRRKRREREQETENAAAQGRPFKLYEPVWFRKERNSLTGSLIHMYKGNYWECKEVQDWSMCPNLFTLEDQGQSASP